MAAAAPSTCAAGERPAEVVQLFFGRNIGRIAAVSEADWESFLESEIVPRFPAGLSVIDTAGVWRGKDGMVIHELSKSVVLVMDGRQDERAKVSAITQAYKTRFTQEAVLTSRSRSCVAL